MVSQNAYVQSHPVRARILALCEQDERRSLASEDLLGELADPQITPAIVAYHVRVLRDAGLLPKREPRR